MCAVLLACWAHVALGTVAALWIGVDSHANTAAIAVTTSETVRNVAAGAFPARWTGAGLGAQITDTTARACREIAGTCLHIAVLARPAQTKVTGRAATHASAAVALPTAAAFYVAPSTLEARVACTRTVGPSAVGADSIAVGADIGRVADTLGVDEGQSGAHTMSRAVLHITYRVEAAWPSPACVTEAGVGFDSTHTAA